MSVDFFSMFSLVDTGLGSGTLFDFTAVWSFGVSTAAVGAVTAGAVVAVVGGIAVAVTGGAALAVLFTVGDVAGPSDTGASIVLNE